MTDFMKGTIRIAAVIGTCALAYLALSYAFGARAHAAENDLNLVDTATQHLCDICNPGFPGSTYSAAKFTGVSGSINTITVKGNFDDGETSHITSNHTFLYDFTAAANTSCSISDWEKGVPGSGVNFVGDSVNGLLSVTFSAPCSLNNTHTYGLIFEGHNNNGQAPWYLYGSATAVTGVSFQTDSFDVTHWGYSYNSSFSPYMVLDMDAVPVTPSITITYPVDNSTTTKFNAFSFDYELSHAEFPNFQASIAYGTNPNNIPLKSGNDLTTTSTDSGSGFIGVANIDQNFAVGQTYYAIAFMWGKQNDEIGPTPPLSEAIATSTIIKFTIVEGGILLVDDTPQVYGGAPPGFQPEDCSVYSGGFFSSSTLAALACHSKNVLKDVGNFMLGTDPTALGFLKDNYDGFKTTFPASIFFNLNDSFKQAAADYTASSTPLQTTVWGHEIVFLDSDSLTNLVGSTEKARIFTIIKNAQWVLVGGIMLATIF